MTMTIRLVMYFSCYSAIIVSHCGVAPASLFLQRDQGDGAALDAQQIFNYTGRSAPKFKITAGWVGVFKRKFRLSGLDTSSVLRAETSIASPPPHK